VRAEARIYVAGHRGMVGSALVRALEARGYRNLLLPSREHLDLREQAAVEAFFARERPEYVFLAAARVGGIAANSSAPVRFLYDNLLIAANVIHAAAEHGTGKLLFLGSTCVYPRLAPQPIPESALLTGPLEPTNQWYAVAKIAGIKLCQAYRRERGLAYVAAMPTNLYGPGDNYDLDSAHVLPALLRKFHEARVGGRPVVEVWGSGEPRREFLHVDDCAGACLTIMERYDDEAPINVGTGKDITIRELAGLIAEIVGFRGEIRFDRTRPDGTPRKLTDTSRLRALGWKPSISLREGIRRTYMERFGR